MNNVQKSLRTLTDSEKAAFFPKFFKTGPGEYGEGDKFLGITVPNCRKIAKQFRDLPKEEWLALLHSPWHEERLTALFIMTHQFEKCMKKVTSGGKKNLLPVTCYLQQAKEIVDIYLENTEYVNNWDLVDASAYKILGKWLLAMRGKKEKRKEKSLLPCLSAEVETKAEQRGWSEAEGRCETPELLLKLANSSLLWERRISMVATWWFIRESWLDPTFELSEKLLNDKHDLMHKAVGWMLREAGKKDEKRLCAFLDKHASKMPRTMLRYAIERLDEKRRKKYMTRK